MQAFLPRQRSGHGVQSGLFSEHVKRHSNLFRGRSLCASFVFVSLLVLWSCSTPKPEAVVNYEDEVLELIRQDEPYALVPADLFEQLGWDLPDGGASVKELADSAPGSAFDPKILETLPSEALGYRARWHVLRYPFYGLEWDITGLELTPNQPVSDLPMVIFINGGSANWYEFFVDPLNDPGLAQYLAQKVSVLLITIPGNYKPSGWTEPYSERTPAYLLDREFSEEEKAVRNAIFTFALISEGVERLVKQVTQEPILIAGHSTGGEIQFLLNDRLKSQLRGLSLGWGTGGPALLRRQWEGEQGNRIREYPPITRVRGRSPRGYINGYVGPLNPLAGETELTELEVAQKWFDKEGRRRPQFKQPLQDLEHQGSIENRENIEQQIRTVLAKAEIPVEGERVVADLFSTMEDRMGGYKKMVWTTTALDDGHWDSDPQKARELFVANQFRRRNPEAQIRVMVYDLPMTHYGHIEKPRQLAGATLAAVKWLSESP